MDFDFDGTERDFQATLRRYASERLLPEYARWDRGERLPREYVQELRDGDFRKGPAYGSPWECMHPAGNHRQNPVYLASVSVPLAAFERIERERNAQ